MDAIGNTVIKIVVVDDVISASSPVDAGATVTNSVVVVVVSVEVVAVDCSVFEEVVMVTVSVSVTVTGSHVAVDSCWASVVELATIDDAATDDSAGALDSPSLWEATPSKVKV